jgi:serine/threonine-protein kinase
MRRLRLLLPATTLAAATCGLCGLGAPARAQSETDKVAAESLFEEGRSLIASGKVAEACPKFADSQRLDPSAGTLLNLASCYEKLGRTATAWATYKQAASAANAVGRSEYVATAQRHAEALAPRLARITVTVSQPVEGLQLRRDGMPVPSPEWGQAIPVDPGTHVIEARAPGRHEWTETVVALDTSQMTVTVPALEALPVQPAPPAAAAAAPAPAPPLTSPAAAASPPEGSSGDGQRTMGLVVGGVGIVGLGVAGAFAWAAKSTYDDSLKDCQQSNPNVCDQVGFNKRNDARSLGDAASIVAGVGAAALVTGGVLWFLTPHGQRATTARVAIAPSLGGATIEGTW